MRARQPLLAGVGALGYGVGKLMRLWSDPRRLVTELHVIARNSSIDWESLLTINYTGYLGAGCHVIDVGAHSGLHAHRLLHLRSPTGVTLVEPNPEMASQLRSEFSEASCVAVRAVALGRATERTTFVVNDSAPEESGLRRRRYNDEQVAMTRTIEVVVERLDDWQVEELDYLKVDVEGGEIDVLLGGRNTLNQFRPLVTVEYGRAGYEAYGYTASSLFELVDELDYVILDLFGNPLWPRDTWLACVDRYYWDFVLLPRERLDTTVATRRSIRRRVASRYVQMAASAWIRSNRVAAAVYSMSSKTLNIGM